MTIQQAVMQRRSTRTFDTALSDDESRKIDMLLNRLPKRHFGKGKICVRRIDCAPGVTSPGTYGCISGARHYLAFYADSHVNIRTYIDCGMIAELMALYATRDGMGSCLMTSSVRDGQFARAAGLGGGDSLLLVSPVGRARSPRLAEVIIGRMTRRGTRLPLSRLVFADNAMTTPWQPGPDDVQLADALEGLRLAPSAFNRQPWRVVVADDHVEIHNSASATDCNSWIGLGCAATNYCAMVGIRSESLSLAGTPDSPIIVAPLPS